MLKTFLNKKNILKILITISLIGITVLAFILSDYFSKNYKNNEKVEDNTKVNYSDNSSIVIGENIDVNNETINLNGNTTNSGTLSVVGAATSDVSVTAPELNATSAATGTFVTVDSKKVTVVNGIITLIEQV